MTKILLLNGPPRAGKDTIGEIVANLTEARIYKFAEALKVATHALFYALHGDLSPSTLVHAMQMNAFESRKDKPSPRFYGLTPRQGYIGVSEKLLKPLFGERFFGEVLSDHIERDVPEHAVITDSGFASEAKVLIEDFGTANVSMIQVMRDGCDFSEDSRDWVNIPEIQTFLVRNHRTIQDLRNDIIAVLLSADGWHVTSPG